MLAVPSAPAIISLSDKFIIVHDKLCGINGIEYVNISFINFLFINLKFINSFNFNLIDKNKTITRLAIITDNNNPSTFKFVPNINTTFKTIVNTLKIKLDNEYNFIFPKPLTSAFIRAIKTTAITYGINNLVVFIENIFITKSIIRHAIASIVSIVTTVCVIILFSSRLFLASIRNLNIDSSNVNVINGVINVIIVIIKS